MTTVGMEPTVARVVAAVRGTPYGNKCLLVPGPLAAALIEWADEVEVALPGAWADMTALGVALPAAAREQIMGILPILPARVCLRVVARRRAVVLEENRIGAMQVEEFFEKEGV